MLASRNRPFSFGENWEEFVRRDFSEEKVTASQAHLLKFLDLPNLERKSFLDVGSGSGLHSLAALRSGADRVTSFDFDAVAVKTTKLLWQREGRPTRWTVLGGSILDTDFLRQLERADIVYAWGVLFATGNMWQAIRNCAGLMNPGALFYLALYATTPQSDYWQKVKERYNRASPLGRHTMEISFIVRHSLIPELIRLRNPFRDAGGRGMSYMTGVRDWLGGLPYEHASIQEMIRFCVRELKLQLTNLNPGPGFAEYLFAS